MLNERAEKLHACLQAQLEEQHPRPTSCTFDSIRYLQDYELLREIDCNPKRDPAFPRRTRAYRFLE